MRGVGSALASGSKPHDHHPRLGVREPRPAVPRGERRVRAGGLVRITLDDGTEIYTSRARAREDAVIPRFMARPRTCAILDAVN